MFERALLVIWFRCECGKAHLAAGCWSSSTCTCGRRLWEQLWRNPR